MKKTKKRVGNNLYLVTFEGGRSYYVVRFKSRGKSIERSLGNADNLTLREARLNAAAVIREYENGKQEVQSKAFGELYEAAIEDIERVKQWKNPKSEMQWRNTVATYALPFIGHKSMARVTRDDIVELLKPIWFEKPDTASKLQQRLDAIFNWAIVRRLRSDSNPATWRGNLEFFFPAKSKVRTPVHHEAPTLEELRKVVAYCRRNRNYGSGILLFTIATVCRITEARLATADQIQEGLWIIPAENQKVARDERRVPLSALAVEALSMASDSGRLFPGTHGMLAVDTPRLKLQSILNRKVTVHGIRSTFRDWCAENGVPDAVAEKCLSHQWGNKVTQAYYRSDLLDERREVLERWARAVS